MNATTESTQNLLPAGGINGICGYIPGQRFICLAQKKKLLDKTRLPLYNVDVSFCNEQVVAVEEHIYFVDELGFSGFYHL